MTACRILVVRLGAMGDIIHALPAVASLKQSFPHCHLAWVVEERWAALLEGNPFVDEIFRFDRRDFRAVLSLRRKLRTTRWDFAVDMQGLMKSALVASAARPDRIYGYDRSQCREPLAALFYSRTVRVQAEHIVDRHLELVQGAGAFSVLKTFHIPDGYPEGVLPDGDFVLASPLAGWCSKQWPAENYADLAKRLKQHRVALVLNVPPGASVNVPGAYIHRSGVPGLIHATRRAAAVVGVDSGPMHLAAALGKPGVAVFGPTDPKRNGPYGNTLVVLRSPRARTSYKRRDEIDESMRELRPDDVAAILKERVFCTTEP